MTKFFSTFLWAWNDKIFFLFDHKFEKLTLESVNLVGRFNRYMVVLVDILLHEHNLVQRLRSVKRFFLLDQGDFLNQFIDLADEELKMPVSHITQSRLEALLEISIRTSAADKDPYKDDLRVVLSPTDLITQLMRIISIDSHDEEAVRRLDTRIWNHDSQHST